MTPTLHDGDIVRVVPVGRPRRGQVIVYEGRGGAVIVHRAVRVTPSAVVCRGDNRRVCDEPASPAAVIGRAVAVLGGPAIVDSGVRLAVLELSGAFRRTASPQWRLRRLRDEALLLLSQIRGAEVWTGPLSDHGSGETPTGALVLTPADVGLDGSLAAALPAASAKVVVPAGVYCRLAPAARSALLSRLAKRDVIVFAYPRPSAGCLLRLLLRLRIAARRAGRSWGTPGDAMAPDRSGATVHLYDHDEFQRELLAEAGGRVRVEPVDGAVPLRRAEIRADAGLGTPATAG